MRRRAGRAVIGVLLAGATMGVAGYPGAEPAAKAMSFAPVCRDDSWVAGTSEWCDGTFVHRDHVYDDAGADTGDPAVAVWDTTGTVDHRTRGQSLNSADLVTLSIRPERDDLVVRFELNTLLPNDRTVAALAIDVDDDQLTGGGRWPGVAVSSRGWDEVHRFDTRFADANVIQGSIPRPKAPTGSIRIQAVVALGDGTPMNVAFRTDERGTWWEDRQAAALTAGDISHFGERIRLRDFAPARSGGRTQRAPLPGPGLRERVFRSRYAQGEGIEPNGRLGETTAKFHFVGRNQPYAVYVPPGPGPFGVQLVLHGASENHSQLVSLPGMQRVVGDAAGRILVSPLGRGPENSWVDWAARDALDALDDVLATYPTDPERVHVSGYSMGGGGTMFLSTLFPDRFASATGWAAFTGDALNGTPLQQGGGRPAQLGAVFSNDPKDCCRGSQLATRGNSLDYLDNVRHVPSGYLFGAADEVVWANHANALRDRFERLGYVHRFWLHAAEHLTWPIVDDWRKETAWTRDRRVVRRPARVTYRMNSFNLMPMVDLAPDGAYWVDRIRPRDDARTPAGDALVDLTSHACPSGGAQPTTVRRDAGTDPLPWAGSEAVPVGSSVVSPEPVLSGSLRNVATLTIDLEGACFAPGQRIDVRVTTDGPTAISLSDGRTILLGRTP